jgi:hypothetical protein
VHTRVRIAASLLVAVAAATSNALGAEPRIVVLTPAPGDPVSHRIQAELRALRFEVPEVVVAPEPPSRARLEELARSAEAVAAVRVAPSSAGVEVWIVDRMTKKTVLREIVTDDTLSPGGVAAIALRVVELLRASVMELDAPRAPSGEVAPPPQIRELLTPPTADAPTPPLPARLPSPPVLSIELGPAALVSPGGLDPAGDLALALHLRPAAGPGATLFVLFPLIPSRVSGPEGVAAAHPGLLGAAFRWVFAPAQSRWTASAGAGVAGLWLHVDATPAPRYVASAADLFTFAPFARAGAGYAAAPRLRIRTDVLAGLAMPRPVIVFGDRIAAAWGRPFFAPTLGIELSGP